MGRKESKVILDHCEGADSLPARDTRFGVVDGHGLLYRSFHAIRDLSTSLGRPTNGTYGFFKTLLKAIRTLHLTHLAVAFDSEGPTIRREAYAGYKAGRPPMPEGLIPQIEDVLALLNDAAVIALRTERIEADDLMASAAKWALGLGWGVVLVSADKDVLQLVKDDVVVYNPIHNAVYDAQAVEKRLGVSPANVIAWLALAGDATDAIPGVPGIGQKTAAKLLAQWGSLDDILLRAREGAHADKALAKVGKAETDLLLWRSLAALRDDVPLALQPEQVVLGRGKRGDIEEGLGRLEMPSLIREAISVFAVPEMGLFGDA